MTNVFFQWLGLGVALLFGVAACLNGAGYVLDMLGRHLESRDRLAKEIAVREAGCHLARVYYWYSEQPAAMLAVKALGEQMAEGGWVDVSKARDLWREGLKKAEREGLSQDTVGEPLAK